MKEVAPTELRFPKVCIDPTYKCNLSCLHCFVENEKILDNREEAVTPGDWRAMVASLLEWEEPLGLEEFVICGGEPFIVPEKFGAMLEALRERRRARVTIGTAGWFDVRPFLPMLRTVDEVGVSLHGASPATHDTFVRRQGAFGRALDSIAEMVGHGVTVTVNMSFRRGSLREVERMVALAWQLGVRSLRFNALLCMGRATASMMPMAEEKAALFAWVPEANRTLVPGARAFVLATGVPAPDDTLQLDVLPDSRLGVRFLGLNTLLHCVGAMRDRPMVELVEAVRDRARALRGEAGRDIAPMAGDAAVRDHCACV